MDLSQGSPTVAADHAVRTSGRRESFSTTARAASSAGIDELSVARGDRASSRSGVGTPSRSASRRALCASLPVYAAPPVLSASNAAGASTPAHTIATTALATTSQALRTLPTS
ncbi:hypothetical protein [Streptomyces sp. Ac-502]|uniref:hypothetical protein n=1 Tax=Streptomyces sp. Ac-502 TaxID=3342801 RepID=UPI0038626E77